MRPSSSLSDSTEIVAADTSVIINLNATACASEIIRALPNKMIVAENVMSELRQGCRHGRQDAELLNDLVSKGIVEIVPLGELAGRYFEDLVIGPAIATLDDGEAATIACAIECNGIAVIDERNRSC
jgi:predicted nucleic acid-binding protein